MKRIAVVTGASSGMGKQFVLSLKDHAEIDEVWAIARHKEALESLQDQVPFAVKPLALDLTDPQSLAVYQAELEQEDPDIRVLVNASGYGIFNSLADMKMTDASGMVDLNCRAVVTMTKASLPYLHRGAKIIEIASIAAFQPIPYMAVYGASKAFVLSFSRAVNSELEAKGIQCIAVCPYWTKTKFFDRAVDPEHPGVVKKYVVMYHPRDIVDQTWKDLAKGKDKSVYGAYAQVQAFLCRVLPHPLVMKVWKKQQGLK
jgi:short-subunit dehydrogenase